MAPSRSSRCIQPTITNSTAIDDDETTAGATSTTSAVIRCLHRVRLTGLWSLWYCALVLSLHMYLTAGSIQQFVSYISLPWPDEARPFPELNAFVAFVGAGVALMPFFAVSAVLRVGNLANDGCRLGVTVPGGEGATRSGGRGGGSLASPRQAALAVVRTMWRHGGPTAPFLHVVSAFCLLFPRVLVQAKLIKYGFLPKEDIWRTDLDFMIAHKDRLVVLGFLTSAATGNRTDGLASVVASTGSGNAAAAVVASQQVAERAHSNMSPEFINYAAALLVYSIRYPSVFWETNKPFSFLFSLQLVLGSVQSLFATAAFAVLYKANTFGLSGLLPLGGATLLSRQASVLLFLASSATVTLSGGVVYLYGLRRFQASLVRQRAKHHISWREGSRTLWGYLPHCLAFAVLLGVLVLSGPLMYDLTVIYRGSLDGTVLSGVVGTFLYLFLWIVLWFALTLKQRWRFRLCPGATMCQDGGSSGTTGRHQPPHHRHPRGAPLIVVSGGHSFTVKDSAPKRAILGVVQKSVLHQQRCRSGGGVGCANNEEDDSGDDIYWLKPKLPVVAGRSTREEMESPAWSASLSKKKNRTSPGVKHKVTFEDDTLGFGSGGGSGSLSRTGRGIGGNAAGKSPKSGLSGRLKKPCVTFEDLTDSEEDDDGDYATLRDIPLPEVDDEEGEEDDEDALENLLQQTVDPSDEDERDSRMSYDGRGPAHDCNADPELLRLLGPVHRLNVAVTVHDESPSPPGRPVLDLLTVRAVIDVGGGEPERQPLGATTPRSNSVSSSSSPPDKGGGSSDTSSGIHSSSSIVCCDASRNSAARSSSCDDLTAVGTPTDNYDPAPSSGGCGGSSNWKSMSLQRAPAQCCTTSPSPTIDSQRHRAVAAGNGYGQDGGSRVRFGADTSAPSAALTPTSGSRCANQFGRATNVRLTSFTDGGNQSPTRSGAPITDTTSLSAPPLSSGAAAVVGGRSAANKMSPLTIGVLSGSPKHYHHNHHSSQTKSAPSAVVAPAKGVLERKRDSANYSLTSSGDSDGCLFLT